MGVFDDKKFEELDWISQATEPIDSELNEYLGKLPDRVDIDFATYVAMIGDSYSLDLSIDRAISYIINKYCDGVSLSWDQREEFAKCFAFELEGSNIDIDFESQVLVGGSIALVKLSQTMDEKSLEKMLGREGIMAVRDCWIPSDGISRMNEVMELLGKCDEGLRSRSPRKKRHALYQRLTALFKANEWNIRDTALANKVGKWIAQYVKEGNLAALSNFCRLKVMTHKNQPIYSMEEVE